MNVSLYGSLDDSNSSCDLLVDLWRSSDYYDPLHQYVCFRTGQYTYMLCAGEDVLQSGRAYLFTAQHNDGYTQIPASFNVSTYSGGLNITSNGYYYVGSLDGTLQNFKATQNKFYSIVAVCVVICAVLTLFKLVRRVSQNSVGSSKSNFRRI